MCRSAVGSPSKINVACPNIATWYSVYRSIFKNEGVSKRVTQTTPVLSASSIIQLGTVMGLLYSLKYY